MGKATYLYVLGTIAVLLLALIVFQDKLGFTKQEQLALDEQNKVNPLACPESTGKITISAFSLLKPSTAISAPTYTAGFDGSPVTTSVTSGTTTSTVGSQVQLLVSNTTYLDKGFNFAMPCGGKTVDAALYKHSATNPGIRIKNDDGDFVTDNILGGAVNQTNVAEGETIKLDIEFSGVSLESSGEGIFVIEFAAGTGANITKVELSGATMVPKPTVHTSMVAGGELVAFKIPPIVGSDKSVHTLSIELAASKDVSAGVYTDWYTSQDFVNDDGSIGTGVEDSDGTAKYEETHDFDFYINAA